MQEKMLGNKMFYKKYDDQHYSVLFNKKTGYFVRAEDVGFPEPLWSIHGPELLDISITNWCNQKCSFCYRNSSTTGHHISIDDYELIIQQASQLDVLQVALGGGNPNQHPKFVKLLEITAKYGIIPCYTTNGEGLTRSVLKSSEELCGAVAISAYEPYDVFSKRIAKLLEYNLKVNIHFILDCKSIDVAISWLSDPPDFLKRVNSIVFLNYKPVGNNSCKSRLLKDVEKIRSFYELVNKSNKTLKIGFDSCSMSGVVKYLNIDPALIEGCDAARFSAFIDENLKMRPCSFMCETEWFGDLRDENMLDIWQNNVYFKRCRSQIINNGCSFCLHQKLCMGGCPFIDDLSQCGWKDEYFSLKSNEMLAIKSNP